MISTMPGNQTQTGMVHVWYRLSACSGRHLSEPSRSSASCAQTGSLAKAADQPAQLEAAATALNGWCDAVEALLVEAEART